MPQIASFRLFLSKMITTSFLGAAATTQIFTTSVGGKRFPFPRSCAEVLFTFKKLVATTILARVLNLVAPNNCSKIFVVKYADRDNNLRFYKI